MTERTEALTRALQRQRGRVCAFVGHVRRSSSSWQASAQELLTRVLGVLREHAVTMQRERLAVEEYRTRLLLEQKERQALAAAVEKKTLEAAKSRLWRLATLADRAFTLMIKERQRRAVFVAFLNWATILPTKRCGEPVSESLSISDGGISSSFSHQHNAGGA